MAIRILSNSIKIGDYTLSETSTGISFDGISRVGSTINMAGTYIGGTVSGYTSGGGSGTYGTTLNNTIDKFPFASNSNATDVGDLTQGRYGLAGQSSTVSGYSSAGGFPALNTIDKFPFATNANATNVGTLTQARYAVTGQSSSVSGYTSVGSPITTRNDKFPFATNANATNVGTLTQARFYSAGQSSTVSGYVSGGTGPPYVNIIDKFPFASNFNATDVGDLTVARYGVGGQSSTVSGYSSGGVSPAFAPAELNVIDKFPFASDANATDVGDLSRLTYYVTGQSSTVSGYTSGGLFTPAFPTNSNIIDKFPFASNANATDVGDLTVTRAQPAGQQV